jgi:hypothetical protein
MLALLALFEAIAITIHFEDMNVVGQPVEQGSGEPLGAALVHKTRSVASAKPGLGV